MTNSTQTITFNAIPTANQTYGASFVPSAIASSGLPVTYTVTGNATANGSTVNITGLGTITITASQTGNGSYAAAYASHANLYCPSSSVDGNRSASHEIPGSC